MNNYLITGITGQDGVFLTNTLLNSDTTSKIYGISRNQKNDLFYKQLYTLNNFDESRIKILTVNLSDKNIVHSLLSDLKPSQIYNFSGPSSVYKSYNQPDFTKNEITGIFNNLTNSLIKLNYFPKFFQSSSSEMFGKKSKLNLTVEDPFSPISPYAEAKLINHFKVLELYKKYNWKIYSGIMFNHESEFRKNEYLIMKIIQAAYEIKNKSRNNLTVGSLDYKRDWLYAQDTVDAIHMMVNFGYSNSHIISSGKVHSIKQMITAIFEYFSLDWNKYVELDETLLRDGDPIEISGNPEKLIKETGWSPKYSFEDMILKILNSKFS